MAHTFDIRFARTAGFAGLFEAPGNSLGWRGGGLISIDAQGVSIAAKRGIASLLARRSPQRIPAESINEVYREGEALRFEFATEHNARTILPVWARDREIAAQIVRLLPTSRTIEFEHGMSAPAGRSFKRTSQVLGTVVVLLAGGALFIGFNRAPAPDVKTPVGVAPAATAPAPAETAAAPRVPAAEFGEPITPEQARLLAILAEDPVDWTAPPVASSAEPASDTVRAARTEASSAAAEPEGFVPSIPEIHVSPATTVVPVRQGSLAYDRARGVLARVEALATELDVGFREFRDRIESGNLSQPLFIRHLDADRERWGELGRRIGESRELQDPELTGFRATLIAVVEYQMRFLGGYVAGLRAGDQATITRAFEDQARAQEFLASARAFVR